MTNRQKLPRGRRGAVSGLVGLVLLAATVLAAVAAFQVAGDRDHTVLGHVSWVADRLRTRDWTDVGVLIAGIAFAVAGLILLLAGVLPARRPLVRLADLDPNTISGIARRGLRRDLTATAAAVDGVSTAKVKVRRRRIAVRARSALRDRTGLRDAVVAAVDTRITALHPARPYSVSVRVVPGRS